MTQIISRVCSVLTTVCVAYFSAWLTGLSDPWFTVAVALGFAIVFPPQEWTVTLINEMFGRKGTHT